LTARTAVRGERSSAASRREPEESSLSRNPKAARASAVTLALMLMAGSALGQNYQQVAPNVPTPQAPATSGPPTPAPATLPKGAQTVLPA